MLDDNKKLCLMSGEIIQMSSRQNMVTRQLNYVNIKAYDQFQMFEPADLLVASPATVSRCGMIYLEPHQLGWRPFFESWLNDLPEPLKVHDITQLLRDLCDWLLDPCRLFVEKKGKVFVVPPENHLAKQFLTLFTCLLDPWRTETPPNLSQTLTLLEPMFLFALVWGVGASLMQDSRVKFDEHLRTLLNGTVAEHPKPKSVKLPKASIFPDRGLVYDFFFNIENGTWIHWSDKIQRLEIPATANPSTLIIQTVETIRQVYFLETFLHHNVPVLFVGPTGTGKSAIVNDYLLELPKDVYIPNNVNFSARTTAGQTQDIILSKLDRRRKGVFGPPVGKKCVVFVDDLNMPAKEKYGAQPPIEILRMWQDHGYWYDKDTSKLELSDVSLVAAMGPPGGGRNDITARFLRHFNLIGIDSFDDTTMTRIFGSIADWHFGKGFDSAFGRLSKLMISATAAVYKAAISTLLPTPTKSHYTFNLRDFSRVVQGAMMVPPSNMTEPEKLIRLWVHEV